jgi:hypothetical protein
MRILQRTLLARHFISAEALGLGATGIGAFYDDEVDLPLKSLLV